MHRLNWNDKQFKWVYSIHLRLLSNRSFDIRRPIHHYVNSITKTWPYLIYLHFNVEKKSKIKQHFYLFPTFFFSIFFNNFLCVIKNRQTNKCKRYKIIYRQFKREKSDFTLLIKGMFHKCNPICNIFTKLFYGL